MKYKKLLFIVFVLIICISCSNLRRNNVNIQPIKQEEVRKSELDGVKEEERHYIDGLQFIEYVKMSCDDYYHAIYDNSENAIIPFSREFTYFSEYYAYVNGTRKKFFIGSSSKYGDELFDAKFNTIISRRKSIDIIIETNQTFSYVHTSNDNYEGAIGMDGRNILDINSRSYEVVDLKELDSKHLFFETWNNGKYELYDLDGRLILEAVDYWLSDDDKYIYYDTEYSNNRKMKIRDIINGYNVG